MSYQSYMNQALNDIYKKKQSQGYGLQYQGYGGYNPPTSPFSVQQALQPGTQAIQPNLNVQPLQGYNVKPAQFASQKTAQPPWGPIPWQPPSPPQSFQPPSPRPWEPRPSSQPSPLQKTAQPSVFQDALQQTVYAGAGGAAINPMYVLEALHSGKLDEAHRRTYQSWLDTWGYAMLDRNDVPYVPYTPIPKQEVK